MSRELMVLFDENQDISDPALQEQARLSMELLGHMSDFRLAKPFDMMTGKELARILDQYLKNGSLHEVRIRYDEEGRSLSLLELANDREKMNAMSEDKAALIECYAIIASSSF